MPAKRIIICDKTSAGAYRYVLWADVPAGNQTAYRSPTKASAYENITAAELQAIRDGLVAERVGSYSSPGESVTAMQTNLQSFWTAFQSEITAETLWAEYGRFWSNVPAWNASPGVPMLLPDGEIGLPTFFALTPVSVFGASKFHFVLFNNAAGATSQGLIVKVRMVVVLPGLAAVTGVAPSVWTLRRRESPTTAPAGGVIAVASADSAHVLPGTITIHNAPTTAPLGGAAIVFNEFVPQADEQKLSTLDAPSFAAASPWGGVMVYRHGDMPGMRPIALRPNQCLEVQQSGTAGTGNCRVLCAFTVG